MKSFKKTPGYLALLLAISSVLLLSACLKGSEPQPAAGVSLVNAASSAPTVDLYIDNYYLNADPLPYSAIVPYLAVSPITHVLTLTRGNQGQVMSQGNATFASGKFYTVYATNRSAANDSLALILVDDDVTATPTGKAKLRLANLAPDAPAIDLGIEGGTVLVPNIASFKVSDFLPVDPGTFTLNIRPAGTTTSKVTKPSVVLEAGKIYTIVSLDNWASANYAMGLVTHN